MELDGCQYITSQINLTKYEVSSIHTLSNHYHWGVSSPIGLIHRVPQENLLHRFNSPIHEKKRDMVYGEDRHQMKDPMKKGGAVADRGGVWVPIIYPDMTRFSGSHYQMPQMRLYATIYGSYFTTVYGTHSKNMYRFTNAPWVKKICLVLSHVIGMGIFLSEI